MNIFSLVTMCTKNIITREHDCRGQQDTGWFYSGWSEAWRSPKNTVHIEKTFNSILKKYSALLYYANLWEAFRVLPISLSVYTWLLYNDKGKI